MLSIFNLSGGTAQSGRSHCSIQAEPLLNFAGRTDFAERCTHFQETLAFPHIVRDVIPVDPLAHVFFWYPEVRQDYKLVVLVQRRKDQHEGCNIRGGREVQTAVADSAFEIVFAGGKSTAIPFLHRHPSHSLLDPLVKPELPKGVLLGRVLLCRLTSRSNLVDADRDTERGIRFLPDLRVRPVVIFIGTVDDRVKGRVNLAALDDVFCLLVRFVADGFGIRTGCGYKEVKRLHTSITGALGHNIKELPVGLGVQLIEHHAVNVEAVLRVGLCRQNLIKAVCRQVHNPLCSGQDFDSAIEGRTHPDHVGCDLKNNRGLLPVRSAAVDLRTFLTVAACEQECNRSRKLRFAHLLGYLNVGGVELPISVGLDDSEDIPDDLLLPVDYQRVLSG